jgi:hypothetical protein
MRSRGTREETIVPKALQQWKVLPHGNLDKVDDKVMTVVGQIHMPLMDLPRRMTVVRLAGSRLVIFSAIALDEAQMSAIEAFGRPAYLLVPSDKHRLDAKIWKIRYPEIRVVAPSGSQAKIQQVVSVDTTDPRFDDPDVQFVTVAGTRNREAALIVKGSSGTTLVLNDVVGNIHDETGIGGWLLRRFGFAGSNAQIPKVVKMVLINDTAALRAQLSEWAGIESLKRILVSHGAAIEDNPRQVLRDLAASLK